MFKLGIAFTMAAIVAVTFVLLTSPAATVSILEAGSLSSAATKIKRVEPVLRGAQCSKRSWPNFDNNCEFDLRNPSSEARIVRIIAIR